MSQGDALQSSGAADVVVRVAVDQEDGVDIG